MPNPSSRPPPAPGHVRLATASPASGATTAQTLTNLRALARRAATAHRADILLLPEAYVGGYPRGSAFGCVVGQRTAAGRDEFLRYWEQAVDLGDVVGDGAAGGGADWVARALPGDAVAGVLAAAGEEDGTAGGKKGNKRGDGTREVLEEVAAETGLFLVTGVIEKAGGSLYCAVVYVCPQRGMIGKRRKVLPVGDFFFPSSFPLPTSFHSPYFCNQLTSSTTTTTTPTRPAPNASSGPRAPRAPSRP